MESQSFTQEQGKVPAQDKNSGQGLGNVLCKTGKGWTCVITKTEGPDAGKVFAKCGENCNCTLDGGAGSPVIESSSDNGSETFCKCGEGWSCSIFKTEGPGVNSGKGFAECTQQYNCACNC
ncbi:hypothetical protein MtrunA17_Chr5g0411241 [Medicago truncatula]|uniref:Uncharacterized protein n=1 Tax=Medicago truncatula TaxID=3880 RepID=G7KF23_MEDTR|nr:uncharacterized protein LOC25494999 [Medicago truncatula]AES95858.1 hypothetical protein MTR_5g030310 [Medicago truncatula]RHN54839.1 hypothetical protein MtrunA17_Chr5g0411241 [Medicago truncatula]